MYLASGRTDGAVSFPLWPGDWKRINLGIYRGFQHFGLPLEFHGYPSGRPTPQLRRPDRLGGLIHEYELAA